MKIGIIRGKHGFSRVLCDFERLLFGINELQSTKPTGIKPFLDRQRESGLRFNKCEYCLIRRLETFIRNSHEHRQHVGLTFVIKLNYVARAWRIVEPNNV